MSNKKVYHEELIQVDKTIEEKTGLKVGEFKRQPNGVTWYNFGREDYSVEEILQAEEEFYGNEEATIEEILQDGYIEFPVMFENNGEIIWGKSYLPPNFVPSNAEGFKEQFGMDFNIYIPSYKRADNSLTFNYLRSHGFENVYMCVDPSQYKDYKDVHGIEHLIVRDPTFRKREKQDTMSSMQLPPHLRGASSIFNPILWLSKSLGEKQYYMMDDDLPAFGARVKKYELQPGEEAKYDKDKWYRASSIDPGDLDLKEYFKDIGELFVKIRNRHQMGLEKYGIAFMVPFIDVNEKGDVIGIKQTRCYSCYLTCNQNAVNHLGRQNDDIATSLLGAKMGYTNMVLSGGITYHSIDTQSDNGKEGGMTETYDKLGTLDKGIVLVTTHPADTKISYNYNRIHHTADYSEYTQKRLLGEVKV